MFSRRLTTLSSFRINPFLEFIFFHIFVESEFLTKEGMEGALVEYPTFDIPSSVVQQVGPKRWT